MRITKIIEKISLIGGVISAICILLMTALIVLEILLRSTTGISILICEEYSAYLLVVFGAMALAHTFKSGGHIRVDLILSKLSPRVRRIVDLGCTDHRFFCLRLRGGSIRGVFLRLVVERGNIHVLLQDPSLGAPDFHRSGHRINGLAASLQDSHPLSRSGRSRWQQSGCKREIPDRIRSSARMKSIWTFPGCRHSF